MELIVKPEGTDLLYQAFFEEPIVDRLRGDSLMTTVVNMAKAFGLRLNNIKLNNETPSDNFVHFFMFEGISSFEVSFGFEEVSARLIRPLGEEQVVDLYGKLWQFLENLPIARQRIYIQQQLSSEGDTTAFLKALNPYVPNNFEKLLHRQGVYYTLKVSEHQLKIYLTVVPSIFRDDWLFLSIDNEFSPNLYVFQDAFKIAKDHREFILRELNLKIQLEK